MNALWWMLCAALSFAALRAAADCPETALTVPVQTLIAAKGVASLDRAFARAGRAGDALTAVYRKRRLVLNPTRAEERRYFDSLPKTDAELFRIYRLMSTRDICAARAAAATAQAHVQRPRSAGDDGCQGDDGVCDGVVSV